jgi:hypothetical protein
MGDGAAVSVFIEWDGRKTGLVKHYLPLTSIRGKLDFDMLSRKKIREVAATISFSPGVNIKGKM